MEDDHAKRGVDTVSYGRRLLNNVVDARAAAGHERPYASIPLSSSPRDGFRDISYGAFANAINRCANWLEQSFGTSNGEETIVYMGPSDLRYHVLALAAVKTGYVVGPSYSEPLEDVDSLSRCSFPRRGTHRAH